MKYVLVSLLAILTIFAVACSKDDPVLPQADKYLFTAVAISPMPAGSTLGWYADVEYAGQSDGVIYLEEEVNQQSHDVEWKSAYDVGAEVTVRFYKKELMGNRTEIATFYIWGDNRNANAYTKRFMNGITLTTNRDSGGGWVRDGDGVWHVQLDCR